MMKLTQQLFFFTVAASMFASSTYAFTGKYILDQQSCVDLEGYSSPNDSFPMPYPEKGSYYIDPQIPIQLTQETLGTYIAVYVPMGSQRSYMATFTKFNDVIKYRYDGSDFTGKLITSWTFEKVGNDLRATWTHTQGFFGFNTDTGLTCQFLAVE